MTTPGPAAWLTTAEAVAYTKKSKDTILRHANAGTLESAFAGKGRGRRYRAAALDAWMKNAPPLPERAAS